MDILIMFELIVEVIVP